MRIANSNVAMASRRDYVENSRRTGGQSVGTMAAKGMGMTQQTKTSWLDTLSLSGNTGSGALGSGTYGRNAALQETFGASGSSMAALADPVTLRDPLLSLLLGRFSMAGMNLNGERTAITANGGLPEISFTGGGMTVSELSYYEQESTSFSALGQAVTEDGRQINFNIDVQMSRSFAMYTQTQIPLLQNAFTDPLVINVGSDVAHISDQKFTFDLDADGTEEEISMPTRGSAFLALDLNEDGVINDGSELFGTKSGDGFADLAQYDSDGNGWIDENDEVFQRLRIWYKNDRGEDELVSLKDADVGAIFLGEQGTDFSLTGSDGMTNAKIRSTGIFLRESTGAAGTVQHVDLATGAADMRMSQSMAYVVSKGDEIQVFEARDANAAQEDAARSRAQARQNERRAEEARRRERRIQKKEAEQRRYQKAQEKKKLAKELYEKQMERKEEEFEKVKEETQH